MSVFSHLFASLALKDDSARPPGVGHLRLTTKEWKERKVIGSSMTFCRNYVYGDIKVVTEDI